MYAPGVGLGASKGKDLGKYAEGFTSYVHMAQDSVNSFDVRGVTPFSDLQPCRLENATAVDAPFANRPSQYIPGHLVVLHYLVYLHKYNYTAFIPTLIHNYCQSTVIIK